MSTSAPRPPKLAALLEVTPAVAAKVQAWQAAVATRQAMWAEYERLAEQHQLRQLDAQLTGRRIRRSQAFTLAERRFDAAEHKASWAEAGIEMELRAAHPGADNRSVMATKRELTRSAG